MPGRSKAEGAAKSGASGAACRWRALRDPVGSRCLWRVPGEGQPEPSPRLEPAHRAVWVFIASFQAVHNLPLKHYPARQAGGSVLSIDL